MKEFKDGAYVQIIKNTNSSSNKIGAIGIIELYKKISDNSCYVKVPQGNFREGDKGNDFTLLSEIKLSTKKEYNKQHNIQPIKINLIPGNWYSYMCDDLGELYLFKFLKIDEDGEVYCSKAFTPIDDWIDVVDCVICSITDNITHANPDELEQIYEYFPEERIHSIGNPKREYLTVFPIAGYCNFLLGIEKHLKKLFLNYNAKKPVGNITGIAWNINSYWYVVNKSEQTEYKYEDLKHFFNVEIPKKELTSLPEKWCIAITDDNQKMLWKWGNFSFKWGNSIKYITSNKTHCGENIYDYIKITTEQFKKWVLKEENNHNYQVGKWYKVLDSWYFKFFSMGEPSKKIQSSEVIDIKGIHRYSKDIINGVTNTKLLNDLSEIQNYLPEGHIDRIKEIVKPQFESGKWYKYETPFNLFYVKCEEFKNNKFLIFEYIDTKNSKYGNAKNSFTATLEYLKEEVLIENIQKYLPNNHIDMKPLEPFKYLGVVKGGPNTLDFLLEKFPNENKCNLKGHDTDYFYGIDYNFKPPQIYSWDKIPEGYFLDFIEKVFYEEPKEDKIKQLNEVVHCTTQKEWEAVLNEFNPNNISSKDWEVHKELSCLILKSNKFTVGCFGRSKFFETTDHNILSFEDWAKRNNLLLPSPIPYLGIKSYPIVEANLIYKKTEHNLNDDVILKKIEIERI